MTLSDLIRQAREIILEVPEAAEWEVEQGGDSMYHAPGYPPVGHIEVDIPTKRVILE